MKIAKAVFFGAKYRGDMPICWGWGINQVFGWWGDLPSAPPTMGNPGMFGHFVGSDLAGLILMGSRLYKRKKIRMRRFSGYFHGQ